MKQSIYVNSHEHQHKNKRNTVKGLRATNKKNNVKKEGKSKIT